MSEIELHAHANLLVSYYGNDAINQVWDQILSCLNENNDNQLQQWLKIGHAVQDIQDLPSGKVTVH